MALEKVVYEDGVTPITAKNLNEIQDAILEHEEALTGFETALDDLHAYAQALIGGGA